MNAIINIFKPIFEIILTLCVIFAAGRALQHLFLYNRPQGAITGNIDRTIRMVPCFVAEIAKTAACRFDTIISGGFFRHNSNNSSRGLSISSSELAIPSFPEFISQKYIRAIDKKVVKNIAASALFSGFC